MKIVILGAGLAGLELGRRLKEFSDDFVILEKESRIGGLCRTNRTGEHYWDFGVHAIYSRSQEIMDYFKSLPLDYEYLNRNVKILHTGRDGKKCIIDYPFEMGIKNLPFRDKLECVRGYLTAPKKKLQEHSNLENWINDFLGVGIARHFMVPYNNKIWNCRLSEISYKLVSSKIEPASIIDFMLSVFGIKIVGRAYQAKFIYPKFGIQRLIDYTANNIRQHVLVNSTVNKLMRHQKKWVIMTAQGAKIEADAVISTMPLVELLKIVDIAGLKKEYDVFKWNNTFFVMVGLKRGFDFKFINHYHWVFFKGDEAFYRVTLMHNFSSRFPIVLVAEITQKEDFINKTDTDIVDLVINDLIRNDIIDSRNQVAETDIKLLRYTYAIPTVGLEDVKDNIRRILKEHKIFLLGRNGNWDYINMDGVIQSVDKFINESKGFLFDTHKALVKAANEVSSNSLGESRI